MKKYKVVTIKIQMDIQRAIHYELNKAADDGWNYEDLKYFENMYIWLLIMSREE